MSYPYDTREDVAREIYSNGWHSEEFRKLYPTWQDFMESDDFNEEMDRLRSKFEQEEQWSKIKNNLMLIKKLR